MSCIQRVKSTRTAWFLRSYRCMEKLCTIITVNTSTTVKNQNVSVITFTQSCVDSVYFELVLAAINNLNIYSIRFEKNLQIFRNLSWTYMAFKIPIWEKIIWWVKLNLTFLINFCYARENFILFILSWLDSQLEVYMHGVKRILIITIREPYSLFNLPVYNQTWFNVSTDIRSSNRIYGRKSTNFYYCFDCSVSSVSREETTFRSSFDYLPFYSVLQFSKRLY